MKDDIFPVRKPERQKDHRSKLPAAKIWTGLHGFLINDGSRHIKALLIEIAAVSKAVSLHAYATLRDSTDSVNLFPPHSLPARTPRSGRRLTQGFRRGRSPRSIAGALGLASRWSCASASAESFSNFVRRRSTSIVSIARICKFKSGARPAAILG